MYRETIKNYIDNNRDEIVALLEKVVNIDSGTFDKEGVDKVCNVFKEEMEKIGMETKVYEMEEAGNTLVGVLNPHIEKEPIVFIGHMDTVFSTKESIDRPFTIKDGKATGTGVIDMKGGDVIAIYTAKALKEAGYDKRPIKMIFVGDEENGHEFSNATEVLSEEAKGAIAAFNFETGRINNNIVVGRKGAKTYKVKIEGVSVHSGNEPEKGRSAIKEAAYKVLEIESLNDYDRGKLLNVGTINGGVSDNTVAGKCAFGISARNLNREIGEEIKRDLERILNTTYVEGTTTTYEVGKGLDCMEKTEGVMRLFNHINDVAVSLGYEKMNPIEVGGGSDSATTVSIGIPTVCGLGAKGEFQHTRDEYLVVDSLFERIDIAANAVWELE